MRCFMTVYPGFRTLDICSHKHRRYEWFRKKRRSANQHSARNQNGWTQAAVLRAFGLIVFLSRFAANSLATAFWSFSVSTR